MKPIEFEDFEMKGNGPRVLVTEDCGRIDIWVGNEYAEFSDPAKLDQLADAIKRAAEALRASQSKTFSDVEPCWYFRFACDRCDTVRQRNHSGESWSTLAGSEVYGPKDFRTEPVIILRATFTEVKP